MILFVLVVGLLNLGLGFFLAAALTEPPPWNQWKPGWLARLPPIKLPWPARAHPSAALSTVSAGRPTNPEDAFDLPAAPKPPGFKLEELPRRWLETLGAEGITPGSVLEASAHVMRLEVSQYREQLITAENRTRANLATADADGLKQLCEDLTEFNREWLLKQKEATGVLKQRSGAHGEYERAATELEQVLHDQAALIEDCDGTIEALHYRTEIETGCKRVFERLGQLLDRAHALRDRLNDLLATVLRDGGDLAKIATILQHDHATGLPNRIGLEIVFHDWWQNDPQRQRQLSAAIIDIDRFSHVNQRLGTRVGDHTVVALSRVLIETFRLDRGTDQLVRLSGQAFVVFLGDTGPHQGLTAIERARQTVEATTWDDHGSEFDLTISSGITEVRAEDNLAAVLRRLAETLKFAKLGGRNRAAVDEGDGPRHLDPPQFTVKGRVVRVGEAE